MVKKILSLLGILFTISVITFLLVKLSPGDPAANYLRASHVSITEENLRATREQLGLNKPLIIQYVDWLMKVLKGNFGMSYTQKQPVLKIIINTLSPTLQLGFFSFLILIIVSPIFGIFSIIQKNKMLDYTVQGLSYIGVSLPTFWVGYILIIIFSVNLKILPVSGRGTLKHIILPAITLVFPLIAQTTFFIRKNVVEEMEKLHYENAVIRGVSKKNLIMNHIVRNISIPLITVFSSNFMYVMTGSVLIEEIFAWPGIGKVFANSVRTGDLPMIQAQLLLFGVVSIVVNELTQWIVKRLDPKLKNIENEM